jgi:nitroreductase
MTTGTGGTGPNREDEALAKAAAVAGRAPSIHNTQPWHWRTRPGALDLWAERSRRLSVTDPDGRMLTISCGAALHHARVALAAEGYLPDVRPFPEPGNPDHLARVRIAAQVPVTPAAMRLYHTISLRHTDRRPVTPEPVDEPSLQTIIDAVHAEGVSLHTLRHEQVVELAALVARAQDVEGADEAWHAEVAHWVGGTRPGGTGVPDPNIPEHAPQTTVPARDFGRPGSLPVSAEHDTAATYAILYGDEDAPGAWLRAGQALSAGWLTANERGVSVLPLSAPVEVPGTRHALRRLLSGLGYPYLVVRLGKADPAHHGPSAVPRLPSDRVIGPA